MRLTVFQDSFPNVQYTLSDQSSRFSKTLIKTIPPPLGYHWVPGGREGPAKPKSRGPETDHQVLKELDARNLSQIV